jgi:hypothetical protein
MTNQIAIEMAWGREDWLASSSCVELSECKENQHGTTGYSSRPSPGRRAFAHLFARDTVTWPQRKMFGEE